MGADEAALGDNKNPTRFAMRGHSTTYMEGNTVLEQLTPQGVLRED